MKEIKEKELERRKKISETMKRKGIKPIINGGFKKGHKINLGKHYSKERKSKISQTLKGHINSEETRKKISQSNKGRKVWNKGLNNVQKYTPERNRKISLALIGDKHFNWKGGKSFINYPMEWTNTLKKAIRERDRYTCQICGNEGLEVHHIDYNKKNCNIENLITLCKKCHMKTGFNRNIWIKYFKKVKNDN